MGKIVKVLADIRLFILAVAGGFLYYFITWHQLSLWYVLAAGVALGIVFGKVFCRWVCPLGLVMELFMSLNPNGKIKQMYQYHKVGCPIAWISGWLNRFSLLRIKLNTNTCKNCGICDKQCYIVAMEPQKFSLYKPKHEAPGNSYTCSKCLKCVAVCPNGSLNYKI